MKAAIICFNFKYWPTSEILEKLRRLVDFFITEMCKPLGSKEIKDRANDGCTAIPVPLLNQVVASRNKSSTVTVEARSLMIVLFIQLEDPSDKLLGYPPALNACVISFRSHFPGVIKLKEWEEGENSLPNPLEFKGICTGENMWW
jgi:hypothetical protein